MSYFFILVRASLEAVIYEQDLNVQNQSQTRRSMVMDGDRIIVI